MHLTITSIINEMTSLVTSFIFWFPATFTIIAVTSIILSSHNPEKRKEAGTRFFWIIIGAFVLISIGGILAVLSNTFFGTNATITGSPGGTLQNKTNGSTCFSTPDCASGETCRNGLCEK